MKSILATSTPSGLPDPQSLCLEFSAPGAPRFLRCVALPGNRPGLTLDAGGGVLWMSPAGAFELWITSHGCLALLRRAGAPELRIFRDARSVEAPVGKPVVLLDQDELCWEGQRVRVHSHGPAAVVHPPVLLDRAKVAGLVLAVGAALAAAPPREKRSFPAPPIQVLSNPPVPPAMTPHPRHRHEAAYRNLTRRGGLLEIGHPVLAACPRADMGQHLRIIHLQVRVDAEGRA